MYLQIVLFLFLISFPIFAQEDQKLIETYTSIGTLVLSHNMLNINLSLALITVTFLFLSFNLIQIENAVLIHCKQVTIAP